MTFTLSPAQPSDFPGILNVWFAALHGPSIRRAFPDTPAVREYLKEAFAQNLQKENQHVKLIVMVEEINGERKVGAFATWSVEQGGKEPTHWTERWPGELGEGMSKETLEAVFRPLAEQRYFDMGERPHWFLEVLATHPDYQKRGLASAIMKWACERIDRDGLEAWLDSSAQGKPLYEKFGFVIQPERVDPTATRNIMRRPKVGER